MRTEIDLHVMQEMGALTRASEPTCEPLTPALEALMAALRLVAPTD